MEKTIHVKAYTKSDGTQVKEHFRNITTTYASADNGSDTEKRGDEVSPKSIGKKVIKWGLKALQIALKLRSLAGTPYSGALGYQFGNAIQNLKETYVQSEKLSQKYLDKLVETKDKAEYENLLKALAKQKEINAKAKYQIAKIEYCAENNDYDSVIEELNNYQSNFDEVVKKNQAERPLNIGELTSVNIYNSAPVTSPYINNYIPENISSPLANKKALDFGTWFYNNINHFRFKNINSAKELWKASSHDFNKSKKYIEKNANLVYSISELPSLELQQTVIEKLQEQLGISDALGVIFKSESRISQLIKNSDELREHFLLNKNELLNGKVINLNSTRFETDLDLSKAIAGADFLNSYIDSNGNFVTIVLDTYDFNEGENWIIQMGRNAQEAKIIRSYYTLSIVKVRMSEWIKWL